MKKLRKLHLNEAQCLQMNELEKVGVGRGGWILSDHCTCKYAGDYHIRTVLSANISVNNLVSVYGAAKTGAEIGGCFGPYVAAGLGAIMGAYVGAELINPTIYSIKMLAVRYSNGFWEHYGD